MTYSFLKGARTAGFGFAAALLATTAFAQTPSTSTNKAVPEHGTASSKSPMMAEPTQPGATKSGQHLPPTTSAKKEGSSHGSTARKSGPIMGGNTGSAPAATLPSTSTNKAFPEHGTSSTTGGMR